MPHHFDAELVRSHLTEDVAIGNTGCGQRAEVIELINTAIGGEREDAFLGKQVIEFKLSELYVQPRTAKDVVEARHDGFKVEGGGGIGGRQDIEGNILFQSAAGVEIETAEIETRRGDPLFDLAAAAVDDLFAFADPMPDRKDTEGDWPVRWILPDRSIALVHELVAVVFELLAEVIQHGPTFMTGRTTQAVLSGEGRQRARRLAGTQE